MSGAGCREKIKRGIRPPVPFWFTGLFMVFTKTSAGGYFNEWSSHGHFNGLHEDHFPLQKRTASRVGFTKTIFRHSQRPLPFFLPADGLFRGFLWSLQRPCPGIRASCKPCGLSEDHFQAHTKTACRKEKRAATRTAFSDYQGNSSTNQLIQLQVTARNCAPQISAIYLADSVCAPNTTTPLFCADLSRPSIASASSGSPRTRG